MADNDTIADIIAEMRRRSDEAYKGSFNYAECQENQIEYDEASEWANRLEAAHKRERGNAAKLREALKAIGGLCAGLMPTWDGSIGRIKDIAEAALAAPPRNCDRFATADEAIGAYRQTHKHMVVNVFLDWLLAPATEKEGGAK